MDTLTDQYGFDERIFISEVPDYFHCLTCSLVLRNPVQILVCGHKMCAVCFERIRSHSMTNGTELSCPVDRQLIDLNDVREDVSSKRFIGNMVVRCYSHERGCKWTGDLRQLPTHTDQCQFKPKEQQNTDAALVSPDVVNELSKRVEECEGSLMIKDKEIALLKQHVEEQQHLREEMQTLKEQMSQLAWKNLELEQEEQQQQKHLDGDEQQQDIAGIQRKNAMLEHQMTELTHKNADLEQRVQVQQQQLEKLQQQNELLQQQLEQVTTKINEKIETVQKGATACESKHLNIATISEVTLAELATEHVVRDQPVVAQKEEIVFEVQCGDPNNVEISKDTHCIQITGPVILVAKRAVVPPGSKVWYEVECTRTSKWSAALRVGWATSELPFLKKVGKVLGSDTYGYAFNPFNGYKSHNGRTEWGWKIKNFSCIVGVALDLIKGRIMFSVNGHWTTPMGVAFSNIPADSKLLPALGEYGTSRLEYNLGDRRFTFPPPDSTFVKLLDVIS